MSFHLNIDLTYYEKQLCVSWKENNIPFKSRLVYVRNYPRNGYAYFTLITKCCDVSFSNRLKYTDDVTKS